MSLFYGTVNVVGRVVALEGADDLLAGEAVGGIQRLGQAEAADQKTWSVPSCPSCPSCLGPEILLGRLASFLIALLTENDLWATPFIPVCILFLGFQNQELCQQVMHPLQCVDFLRQPLHQSFDPVLHFFY